MGHCCILRHLMVLATILYLTSALGDREFHCTNVLPRQVDFARLDHNLTGRLVFPDAPDYIKYNQVYNLRLQSYPLLHAVVKNVEDIRQAVLFAKDHKLPVTIKSTGVDFEGRSSAFYGFTINLMEMKNITVMPEMTSRSEHGEIKLESGATWGEIYEEVDKYERTVAGGGELLVGVGGLTLGGGVGILSTAFGLAIDQVLEIQVVLADGRISTCTENQTIHVYPDGREETEHNGDLFWALRGGGGGTFGVAVYFIYKLHPAQPMVKVTAAFPLYVNGTNDDIARNVFSAHNNWYMTAPSYWSSNIVFAKQPQNTARNFTGMLRLRVQKYGRWDENTESEIQFLYDLKDTFRESMITFTSENKTSYWDSLKKGGPKGPNQSRIYMFGSLISETSQKEKLASLIMDEFLNPSVDLLCMLTSLRGKVSQYSVNSSSVHPAFRSASVLASCGTIVSSAADFSLATFEKQSQINGTVQQFASKLREIESGEYSNIPHTYNPNWKKDLWGDNYDRLLNIKMKYDPDNFFKCNHCVGSDISRSDNVCEHVSGAMANRGFIWSTILTIISAGFLSNTRGGIFVIS